MADIHTPSRGTSFFFSWENAEEWTKASRRLAHGQWSETVVENAATRNPWIGLLCVNQQKLPDPTLASG
jgi:hypothetical protein